MAERTRNDLVFHFCGGGGISVSSKTVNFISELGNGFANIIYNYIDTSDATISKIQPKGDFWKIKTSQHGKASIDGSGSERYTNSKDIQVSVKEYLDSKNYLKLNPNQYHVVVSSLSGGSGSVIGALLTASILNTNIPVLYVGIGDSSNGLYTINTLNSLSSLNQVALRANKPLGIIYVNNHGLGGGNLKKGEEEANKLLRSYLTTLALFTSGTTDDIDNQDIRGLIDQSHYRTLGIKPGLYGLQFFSKEVSKTIESAPTVGRTLTVEGTDFDINIPLLHHKTGYVSDEEAKQIYKDQFPLHMVMFSNFFNSEEENLKKLSDDAYNVADSIKSKEIQGSSKSKVDDDLGLVF